MAAFKYMNAWENMEELEASGKPVEEGWLGKFQIYKAKGRSITFILFIGSRYVVLLIYTFRRLR